MRKYLAFLVVLMCCTCCAAQDVVSQADRYLKEYSDQRKFMGSVIVARAGKVLFKRSYGMADIERDVPNTPQTKFNIASLTKQFTGLAVLQLAERGKLALEDPVSKYYAEAPSAWKTITIYQLLTHTSGIPIYTASPAGAGIKPDLGRLILDGDIPNQLLDLVRTRPLLHSH